MNPFDMPALLALKAIAVGIATALPFIAVLLALAFVKPTRG